MKYDEEKFSEVMGIECYSIYECNMDEENIQYWVDDDSYERVISKKDLRLKCEKLGLNIDDLKVEE